MPTETSTSASTASATVTYYPAYTHNVHPLHNKWVKITAATLRTLHRPRGYEGQPIYFHHNHPIQYISLAGLLTSFDITSNGSRFALSLDDGSGAVAGLFIRRHVPDNLPEQREGQAQKGKIVNTGKSETGNDVDLSGIDVGMVVRVKGCIGEWFGERAVLIEKLDVLPDTAAEIAFWEARNKTWRDVLCKPWVLTDTEVKRLREKVDELAKARREKQRRREEREKELEDLRRKRAAKEERRKARWERRRQREQEDTWRRKERGDPRRGRVKDVTNKLAHRSRSCNARDATKVSGSIGDDGSTPTSAQPPPPDPSQDASSSSTSKGASAARNAPVAAGFDPATNQPPIFDPIDLDSSRAALDPSTLLARTHRRSAQSDSTPNTSAAHSTSPPQAKGQEPAPDPCDTSPAEQRPRPDPDDVDASWASLDVALILACEAADERRKRSDGRERRREREQERASGAAARTPREDGGPGRGEGEKVEPRVEQRIGREEKAQRGLVGASAVPAQDASVSELVLEPEPEPEPERGGNVGGWASLMGL